MVDLLVQGLSDSAIAEQLSSPDDGRAPRVIDPAKAGVGSRRDVIDWYSSAK